MRRLSRLLLATSVTVLPLNGAQWLHAAPRAAASITLTEEDYWGSTDYPNLSAAITQVLSAYEKAHPNVTIKRTTIPFLELQPKVLQQAASHTLPDIVVLDNPNMPAIASADVLTDLGRYTAAWPQYKNYYASSLATATYNGKLYGIPVGNNDIAIYYNTNMFKKAGIAHPPRDWAELKADALKLATPKVAGLLFSARNDENGTWDFEPFFWGNGGDLQHPANAAGVEALAYVAGLVKDGAAPKSVLTWDQGTIWDQFVAGNGAMVINGPWFLPAATAKHLHFGLAYIPRKTASMPPVSPLGGEVWTIAASTQERRDAAWDLIKFTQQVNNIVKLNTLQSYLPAYRPATAVAVKAHPLLKIFSDILPTSKARAAVVGKNYAQVSAALSKALQAAITGQQTPQQAMQAAQDTITSLSSE